MNEIDFGKMSNKKKALYECMWGNPAFDFPVDKTIYRGAPTNNSYTFTGAYLNDENARPEEKEDYCRDRLASLFNIKDRKLFKKKFHQCIGGSGQELRRIATIHSSSLCALLFFYGVSEENPYTMKIDGNEYIFTYSCFEYQNTVIVGRNPSNIDVVLVGKKKESNESIVFFVESKFSEYYERTEKRLYVANDYLSDSISKKIYRNDFLQNLGIIKVNQEGKTEFLLESKDTCYLEGIKQMISHFVGMVKLCQNPTIKDDVVANAISAGAKVLLGEILFTDRIGQLSVAKDEGCFNSYFNKYKVLADELNKQLKDCEMNNKIIVLKDVLSYSVFKDAEYIKEEKIKRFYFELGKYE